MLIRFLLNKLEERDLLSKTDFYSHVEREYEERQRRDAIKYIGIGFTIGSVLTGLFALFLLPKSGKEFRNDVKYKVDKVAKAAEEKTEKARVKGEELFKKADKLFESKKKDVIDFADEVEDEVDDLKEESKLAKLRAKLKAKETKKDVEEIIEDKVDQAKEIKEQLDEGAEDVKDEAKETIDEIEKK